MKPKTLRLILGDQLNPQHSWFQESQENITFIMMEVKSESLYVKHHIQKIIGFFAAMRSFEQWLIAQGHQVIYLKINDTENLQSIDQNILKWIQKNDFHCFEYQQPDEYRLSNLLENLHIEIPKNKVDTEHFFTNIDELSIFFKGKKQLLMESFYRHMRKKHNVLMKDGEPLFNQWNFDHDNRKKIPIHHTPPAPLLMNHNVTAILDEINQAKIPYFGNIDVTAFSWPIHLQEAENLLEYFATELLVHFGTFQDAMTPHYWSLYHSRLSFAMNLKMISPQRVINRVIKEYNQHTDKIEYAQVEGFVRQILGWREYMRGIYWMHMPAYGQMNYFLHERPLPQWYWNGNTKMACLQHSIQQSLQYAYAHHIQRLMITGNFALLAGINPDEVDQWYLGIYIDAIEWVEITNTRGMSQFADGGIVATKPYISSAAYIDKMSHYCGNCYYKKNEKTGDRACPFNSMYWHFIFRNQQQLSKNPRMTMMYAVWNKMNPAQQASIIQQAEDYLSRIEEL